jgi:hypothetical protein
MNRTAALHLRRKLKHGQQPKRKHNACSTWAGWQSSRCAESRPGGWRGGGPRAHLRATRWDPGRTRDEADLGELQGLGRLLQARPTPMRGLLDLAVKAETATRFVVTLPIWSARAVPWRNAVRIGGTWYAHYRTEATVLHATSSDLPPLGAAEPPRAVQDPLDGCEKKWCGFKITKNQQRWDDGGVSAMLVVVSAAR